MNTNFVEESAVVISAINEIYLMLVNFFLQGMFAKKFVKLFTKLDWFYLFFENTTKYISTGTTYNPSDTNKVCGLSG